MNFVKKKLYALLRYSAKKRAESLADTKKHIRGIRLG